LRWRWIYRASLAAVTIDASMDYPRLRELIALSALAALACGLAATQNDLLFVAIFGAASLISIVEAIRCW
jgi:hypothetical protein